ncbi:S1 family peptidase [Bacillaceae bacterium S4-13-58]
MDLFGRTRITVFEETTEGTEDSSRYDQYRPLMGGIILEGLSCTGSFSSTGSYYITAGHCGSVGETIGTITKVANSGPVDAALIKVDNTSWLSNDLFAQSPRDREITDWQAEYEENEGDYVCKAGYKTGYTCGTVTSTYYSVRTHHNMTVASYTRDGGDSGDPVFNGNQLRGIYEGTSSLGAVYSQIDNVQYALGIGVRTY